MTLRILFIGGTGVISTACVRESVALGHDVTVLNRGHATGHAVPASVSSLTADVGDTADVRSAVAVATFDVVADFLSFTPDDVQARLDVFGGRCAQYVFISSASAYEHPARLPVTEAAPLRNQYLQYSRDKIACEST